MSGRMSELMSEGTSIPHIEDKISEFLADRMSEVFFDRMSESMPNRTANFVADRMSGEMDVRLNVKIYVR